MNSNLQPALECPLNISEVLESIQGALEDNFPDDPKYLVNKNNREWIISIYPNRRGDKNGGEVKLSTEDLSILGVKFYQ